MSPIVEAVRNMRAAPGIWRRTTTRGVWYLDVGSRLMMVYGEPGRWWWRGPAGIGRCCRSVRRAMLEAQRAAFAWVMGGGFAARAAKRKGPGKQAFVPRRAPKLDAAAIDKVLAEAPATIREVAAQLAPYVSPP